VSYDDDGVRDAVDIIARRVLRNRVDWEAVGELWEDYPDLGEVDWAAVVRQIVDLVERMDVLDAEYDAAYRFLAARADGVEA
jgi:hypothetical protein